MANRLIKETSPYLQQHAHNPVDWYPWGEEALSKAKSENKLILVSIGYSACHWCHVMEHESFEDLSVAEMMNANYVCIKVDREERPDVDQIYMNAVQLMTGQGGWPLNCICLPDQRPIYGGTYFGNSDWKKVLSQLAGFWEQKPDEAVGYAERLTEGVRKIEKLNLFSEELTYSTGDLEAIFQPWKKSFDSKEGGYNRAPKFPLPNNWQFMLRYAHVMDSASAWKATQLTLKKMAFGGIYDHIGGGFARYSVDGRWHVPHFEKMLYDNAQLVSLYAEAYQYSPDPLYKQVVYETLDWVEREMLSEEGGFYSALDADSEGVEGKFYTFTEEELNAILEPAESAIFNAFYGITAEGNWEEEHVNICKKSPGVEDLAEGLDLMHDPLLASAKAKVFAYRSKRVRPGLDHKILAGWNGMMQKGFIDAYKVFKEPRFLEIALVNANFILKNLVDDSGALLRVFRKTPDTKVKYTAFLDDYSFLIDAFISLYEVTFNEDWLHEAQKLNRFVLTNFFDSGTGLFFYTSQTDQELIARKHEIIDNVIPSSNSSMALNLFKLGHLFQDETYLEQSAEMLKAVFPSIKTYGSGYSNWGILLINVIFGVYEIAITGPGYEKLRQELENYFIPNKILLGGSSGKLPLLQDKFSGKSKIFVCKNRTCRLPVTSVSEALKQILI
ncbi:thioredoxin domain-containing protein [Arcticibacter eurypsychrophilus]|uniref:thioredoxin domain-containing protein n=1 Tax=Arcticibacter eurypsychrophilus TaxID=1434752 RepID=UPI00084D2012|nr:thioredoxin domain-containing protein [Arcticibacter eurypsychrophilus]